MNEIVKSSRGILLSFTFSISLCFGFGCVCSLLVSLSADFVWFCCCVKIRVGTTNILCLDVVRVLRKNPEYFSTFVGVVRQHIRLFVDYFIDVNSSSIFCVLQLFRMIFLNQIVFHRSDGFVLTYSF